jgi:hypothetical protein
VLPVTCDCVCFILGTVYGIDCLVMVAIRQLLRHACYAGQSWFHTAAVFILVENLVRLPRRYCFECLNSVLLWI